MSELPRNPLALPELGQMVGQLSNGSLDYSGVVSWLKLREPEVAMGLGDLAGSVDVAINGERVTVGWLSILTAPKDALPHSRHINSQGGEQMVIVEGEVTISFAEPEEAAKDRQRTTVCAKHYYPAKHPVLYFEPDTTVSFVQPTGPDGICWYVRLYPDPGPETPQ